MARRPCPTCPWWKHRDATTIPGFSLELAEGLAGTCGKPGAELPINARWFGCHQSKEGEEFVCAGWLAAVGEYHLGVRIAVAHGQYPPDCLQPGVSWPPLHETYDEVIEKLRRTTPKEDPDG